MNIKECIEKRILRKINPDLQKTESSIKIAKTKLEHSKRLFEKDFFDEAILSAYTSMFYIARALLYKEGYQEKSHFVVEIFLREKHNKEIPQNILNSFSQYREERRKILYGFQEEITKKEAEDSILDAEEFLEEIIKIIEK